jgi:hypothetical protein
MGGDLLWQTAETFAGAPASERHFVVNYPAWFAPLRIVYPLGHEGVELMPSYANIRELVWVNSGAERRVRAAKFSNALPVSPGYYYGIRGREVSWEGLAARIRDADWVHFVDLQGGARLTLAGRVLGAPRPSGRPMAVFDGRLALDRAEVTVAGDGSAVVRLTWWAADPLADVDLRVFAHAYDDDGNVAAQADGYPLAGLYPFWMWRPQERVEEYRYLRGGSDALGGAPVGIGVYDPVSGARLPARGPDGGRLAADTFLIDAPAMR